MNTRKQSIVLVGLLKELVKLGLVHVEDAARHKGGVSRYNDFAALHNNRMAGR